jgi:solute carrier family 25 folate transporter 32
MFSAPSTWDERTRQTAASQLSGATSSLIVFPLDTMRYRFMAQDGTRERRHRGRYYTSVTASLRHVVREEGAASLYRGAHVAVAGTAVSWGIYMWTYRTLQQAAYAAAASFVSYARASDAEAAVDKVREAKSSPAHFIGWAPEVLGPSAVLVIDCAVSGVASAVNAVCTTPIWHVKTRMQVEDTTHLASGAGDGAGDGGRKYRTFFGTMRRIVQEQSVSALWCGGRMQLLMALPNGVYFSFYEALRRAALGRRLAQPRADGAPPPALTAVEVCLCSTVSKTLVAVATNPLFVVRTRLQDGRSRAVPGVTYNTSTATARLILQREGVRGFFRGVVPSVALTVPRTALCMVLMERCLMAMR